MRFLEVLFDLFELRFGVQILTLLARQSRVNRVLDLAKLGESVSMAANLCWRARFVVTSIDRAVVLGTRLLAAILQVATRQQRHWSYADRIASARV